MAMTLEQKGAECGRALAEHIGRDWSRLSASEREEHVRQSAWISEAEHPDWLLAKLTAEQVAQDRACRAAVCKRAVEVGVQRGFDGDDDDVWVEAGG